MDPANDDDTMSDASMTGMELQVPILQEEGQQQVYQPSGQIALKDHPSMTLTEQERHWALEIRQAVRDCEELKNLSDMECVQYALITKGNLKDAMQRIYGMQLFKEEYGIDDSVEQAVASFREHFQQQPGYVLHFDVDPETHEAMGVLDLAEFYPAVAMEVCREKGPDFNWRVDTTRNYYQNSIVCTSISTIRQGVFMIIDCEEIGWENFMMEYAQRHHSELWQWYPIAFKNLLCYNTGSVANVCWNMVKHMMDRNMRDSLQLGCQLAQNDDGDDDASMPQRLCELYTQPTLEDAQERLLRRIEELVMIRKRNEALFRL